MSSFTNKVVIVTGCSSGIGLATTQLFLERGAKVFGIDVAEFKGEGVSELPFEFHQADLVKAEAAGEAVARCEL
jgi:NAD(P)-dependent dehydrogenase (short-subunit alcohol dehydrogenase family)